MTNADCDAHPQGHITKLNSDQPRDMLEGRRLFSALLALVSFTSILLNCGAENSRLCAPSSCGNVKNIKLPFRLKTDPKGCGYPIYELSCENNEPMLYLFSGRYRVLSINYHNSTVRVVDAAVDKNNCSSVPQYSLSEANFTDPKRWFGYDYAVPKAMIVFLNCANPVNSPLYADASSCTHGRYSHVMASKNEMTNIENLCTIELMTMSSLLIRGGSKLSFMDIHNQLAFGLELQWYDVTCDFCHGDEMCYPVGNSSPCKSRGFFASLISRLNPFFYQLKFIIWYILIGLGLLPAARFFCCSPFVFAFLIHKWRKRHVSMYNNIEEFLESQNNFMPIRYSYMDIRKMTSNFKDKLGEGGYGSVYKGKLRSSRLAAVKVLGKSKSNGQDFINEVATIGRIHHVNVVQLIGFCVEGSKRALIYEFMPNGSLDKYIFHREGYTSLSWRKMYEISLGVARGIEYLHRGCEMQILHFDIKPHNILLDENFTPKVSDFGLAKLYPTDHNTVSLTAARGTMGYIAPELIYKNIGGISYKADVYSFGIILMEMIGKRKNWNLEIDPSSSRNYFPFWVYNQMIEGKVEVGDATNDDEKRIVEKMVIVALWCIQMKPISRPPMNKVIHMLEEDLQSLELPPKPVLYPEETPKIGEECSDERWSSSSSSMLLDSMETICVGKI
ncbi:LEAF RUST 10 DISEASE-RESISTANCE LOCUS RECEPTOR-LIKE PROTEIN KINASE-like 2.4 [Mercurialis annua]|uniref:LEAF RUST 10 DISEASE-RESISTANCE LOCUS RECEPTOR-LIKE PROTEIN KINASE-like 2.4 n=1 Tax=Mercurialis annua TaxID=3986 RepID=UPI00215E1585|nr:LEAF RUST 10 DISEASE-RESISTANCE LOCUS RECEPTOR-LIKE PROTEIN KINASE-like 2.4 [Mercurialis annua]XP_055961281.1 LEAF RUST 10 DISEASE-RESISTANCE LOCUS RECEPTOR-LIKE PROTEIN KINASE-like 2.4 [Mercurialis annua]